MSDAPANFTQRQRKAAADREYQRNRELALERDHYRCVYTGATIVTVHHVIYRSHGVDHSLSNLVTLEVHIHEQVHAGTLFVKSLYERNHHTGEYVHNGWLFSRKKDFSSVEYRGVQ